MQTDLGGYSDQDVFERRNIVPRGFETVVRHDGESLEVALVGELDMAATFKLEAELERLLARRGVRRLVLDLADLGFVDSAATSGGKLTFAAL